MIVIGNISVLVMTDNLLKDKIGPDKDIMCDFKYWSQISYTVSYIVIYSTENGPCFTVFTAQ